MSKITDTTTNQHLQGDEINDNNTQEQQYKLSNYANFIQNVIQHSSLKSIY
jgi:hypothetical protein